MKYETEIIINKPLKELVELFDNPNNMKHWMKGLQSFEHVSGEIGTEGAQSELVFLNGKRKITMMETILKNNLPDELIATYELDGIFNKVHNRFEVILPEQTRYTTEHEFKFKSFSMKVMSFLMPSAFKKQSQKYMEDFKTFAEAQ